MKLPKIESIGIYNSRTVGADGKITKKRIVPMFEIELPIADGGISYIGSDLMHITPDMVICAKPSQVRNTKFPFKCYYIHMSLSEGYLYDTLMNLPDFLVTDKKETYEELFQKICESYNAYTKREEIRLQSLVLELIYTLSKDAEGRMKRSQFKKNNYMLIERSIEYIKEHLTEDLSLEKVASAVSLSPIHFHNIFKKALSKTVHEYVEEQRIKKAINLLLTTELNLTEISYECGFSSQSYFSYVFKRRMKTTPRKYAQEINKMKA